MEVEVEPGGLVFIEVVGVTAEQGPGTVLLLEVVSLEAFVVLPEGKPPKVEDVSEVPGVGQVLDFGRVEEDGEIGVLDMGTVSGGVVGVIDQFDLLDVLDLGLVKVGVGGVDDDADGAGFGDGLGHY